MPDTLHDTTQYANNRAELSHQPTRVRERGMRQFKSSSKHNGFFVYMRVFIICSISGGIWLLQRITGISGEMRVLFGKALLREVTKVILTGLRI